MSFPSPSSVVMNGEEPPLKKNKKASLVLPHTTISSLPDDLVLSCLARVSRLYYPTLSLVSKKFRLLIASPELYEARSLLGSESCLYVCLRFHRGSDPLWFTLCKKLNRNLTNDAAKKKTIQKKSSGYVLATIPIPHSPPVHWKNLVTVGSNIYAIGGSSHATPPSSSVSVIDCRSHTWRDAPSMRVERNLAMANVFDGKIYVAGGCSLDDDSSNWMEVFDPKTETWENVLCPVPYICTIEISKSAVIDGEIVVWFMNGTGVAYKPNEDKWEVLGEGNLLEIDWTWYSYCVIDNVLYCHCYPWGIKWYNSNVKDWKALLGLDGLPKIHRYSRVQLVCFGGKMAVLWDKNLPSCGSVEKNKMIWCAVIGLEKRENNEEIWGNVESLDDHVLTVPSSYEVVSALEATL